MTKDEAKERVKTEIKITRYLNEARKGGKCCPFCGSGTGNNGHYTGAFEVYNDNTGYCHVCHDEAIDGKPADPIALEMYTKNEGYNEALSSLAAEIGIEIDKPKQQDEDRASFDKSAEEIPAESEKPLKTQNTASEGQTVDYLEYYKECSKRIQEPAAVSYLKSRGISLELAGAFHLGFDPAADPVNAPGGKQLPENKNHFSTPRIIIPVTRGHYVARSIDPKTDPQYKKLNNAGGKIGIFNICGLYETSRPVFVTEGAFNALSFLEVGADAIALNSANNTSKLLDYIDRKKPKAPLVLCLDKDPAGRTAEEKLAAGLQAMGRPYICRDITGGYGDNNDYLVADREGFKRDIEKAQTAADLATDVTGINEFLSEIYTDKYKPVSTGIDALDGLLSGGLVPQTLTLLGAQPGSGKTALTSMIFENMAKAGQSGIFLNLEMSKEQLIARSISRRIFIKHKDYKIPYTEQEKTALGIKGEKGHSLRAVDILQGYNQTEETKTLINEAAAEYLDEIGDRLQYNPAGIGTDVNSILEYMERAGQAAEGKTGPNFVIDYLQLISGAGDPQETIKTAVSGFKRYARKYNAIVVCIMAQSRAVNNRNEAVLGAGRDSSSLEYTADLQLQLLTSDEAKTPGDPDAITLMVTKSRFTESSMKRGLKFAFFGGQSYFNASPDGFIPVENTPFDSNNS